MQVEIHMNPIDFSSIKFDVTRIREKLLYHYDHMQ